jgi:hypothetical protein
MLMLALLVGLIVFLCGLAFGHYFFQAPRHVLRGHQVTVYGCGCLLVGLAIFTALMLAAEEPPRWEYVIGVPALYLALGGLLTKAMHTYDDTDSGSLRYRELEMRYEALERKLSQTNEVKF